MLALLVGFTLTLVCMGHDTAHHYIGPHVALLGEYHPPFAEHDPEPIEDSLTPHESALPHSEASNPLNPLAEIGRRDLVAPPAPSELSASSLAGAGVAGRSTISLNAPPEAIGLLTLVVMLFVVYWRNPKSFFPIQSAVAISLKSQAAPPPDHPPPR